MICGGQIIKRVHLESHPISNPILLILWRRIIAFYFYLFFLYLKNTFRDPHSSVIFFHNITMCYFSAVFYMLDVRFVRRNVWKQRQQSLYFYIFIGNHSRRRWGYVCVRTQGHRHTHKHTHTPHTQSDGVCHLAVVCWQNEEMWLPTLINVGIHSKKVSGPVYQMDIYISIWMKFENFPKGKILTKEHCCMR